MCRAELFLIIRDEENLIIVVNEFTDESPKV